MKLKGEEEILIYLGIYDYIDKERKRRLVYRKGEPFYTPSL